MNGDTAEKQIERIRAMMKDAKSKCTLEVVRGEIDSVHLRFHCGDQIFSKAYTGRWLETFDDDALKRELDLATQGRMFS